MIWSPHLHFSLTSRISCNVRGFFFLLLFKKIMHFPVEFAFTGKSRFSGQQSVLNFSDQKLRQIDNPSTKYKATFIEIFFDMGINESG